MKLRRIFLLLSIIATILPLLLIIHAMNQSGWEMSVMMDELGMFLSTVFGQIFAIGYFVAGLSLTIFIVYEATARSDYYLLWAILIVLTIGIGSALPFYLYLRSPRRE